MAVAKNANNEAALKARADEAAKRTAQMPDGVKYAVLKVLGNIKNGAFWGFTDMSDVMQHMEAIKKNSPNILARKLGNACIIEVAPNYMISSVQAIDPQAISQQMIQDIQNARAEAHVAFERFLIRSGKNMEKTNHQFTGTVGLYCTNDVQTMAYRGVQYPAFRVTLADALNYMKRYNYSVKINGQFVPATQAGAGVWDSMLLLPTKNGVLLEIAAGGSVDFYKQAEKQFKATHKIQ